MYSTNAKKDGITSFFYWYISFFVKRILLLSPTNDVVFFYILYFLALWSQLVNMHGVSRWELNNKSAGCLVQILFLHFHSTMKRILL